MYTCAICGYDKLNILLWDGEGEEKYPTHSICYCCGFESGYDDDDIGMTIDKYRTEWVKLGAHWFSSKTVEPPNWDLKKQFENINVDLDELLNEINNK